MVLQAVELPFRTTIQERLHAHATIVANSTSSYHAIPFEIGFERGRPWRNLRSGARGLHTPRVCSQCCRRF